MSKLSSDDRALIDAAVRAGKVQTIPRGVSAIPQPVWDGKALVYPDGHDMMRRRISAQYLPGRAGYVPPEVSERRKKVLGLHAEGYGVTEIADLLSVSPNAIREDHKRLAIAPNRQAIAGGVTPEKRKLIDERRKAIAQFRAMRKSAGEIARLLKVSISTVEADFRALRRVEGNIQKAAS